MNQGKHKKEGKERKTRRIFFYDSRYAKGKRRVEKP